MAVNGKPVEDVNRVRLSISMMKPGTTIQLKLLRNGHDMTLPVTLGELPTQNQRASNSSNGHSETLAGLSVESLTPDIARQLGMSAGTQGVVVDSVDGASPAAQEGLQRGDVIEQVNRKPVQNVEEFEQAANRAGDKSVLLLVNHDGSTRFVVLEAS